MPDTVELSIEKALSGLPLDDDESEICDFNLEEQNTVLESQGNQPIINPNYKPIVRETVNYVVAVVLINDDDQVLMMQEAKQTCAGKWYLPAGRIEKGETICRAAEREVREETGLDIECTTLITIEFANRYWIRFVLTGKVIGGNLKTPQYADEESLQAKWVADLNELSLRSIDILHLIDKTRAYLAARRNKDASFHLDQLPTLQPHSQLLLRLVAVIKKRATNRVHVLISERNSWHLPTCQIHPKKSIYWALKLFMVDLFGADVSTHRIHGILSVEHDPRDGQDGVCFTLLVAFRAPLEEVPIIGKCVWHECSQNLGDKLLARIAAKNGTIPIHVIH